MLAEDRYLLNSGTCQCIYLFWELNTCLLNTGCLLNRGNLQGTFYCNLDMSEFKGHGG